MREPKRRKLVVRFGMASTAIAGVAVYLNEGLVRAGGVAAANEEQATVVPGLKDGERFVPTGLIIDLCTAPGAGETATYRLRRGTAAGALGNNGPALVIPAAGIAGRAGLLAAVSYGPSDRMSLGVTGSGGAAAHTSDARVCGYVIGRGR
jgi:hypothetical protein